ncbi:MAG TPA: nuclear transport factor 2 family protein [Acidimicrobiales bacterium]|nr:nuclear transport factor 2 family protein [Acidimicrobiales bacterium]
MARVEVTPEFWVSPCVRVKRLSALDLPSAEGKRMTFSGKQISPLGNRLKGASMEANELLRIQHEVTSERDPEKRRAAIDQAYVEDLRFLDSQADVVGREAFSDRVQQILDGAPPDFVLEEDGPIYVGPDTAAQPWRFGPPGNPVIRGMDVLALRDGRVSIVRGLVVG